MIYRAAAVTGSAAIEPRKGLINPSIAAINPRGNARDTAARVSRLVSGAMSETYPKWIAVSGNVRISAPVVVAKLDIIKLTITFTGFFL